MLKRGPLSLVCAALVCLSVVAVLWPKTAPEPATTSTVRIRVSTRPAQLVADGPRLFAYVLYATSEIYLCNAVINARRLKNLGITAEADIIVLTDEAFLEDSSKIVAKRISAMHALGVKVHGVSILKQKGDPFWAQSLTKLRFFELEQYKRLIYFDVDGLVLKSMNHLFWLPPAPVAMPRAYWLPQPTMSDQLAVIEPSVNRLGELLHQAETFGGFDMDVMNDLYKHLCLVLPNEYDFLSGELREMNHTNYLGNHLVQWNATAELNKAYYVHFSDFPTPKPWLMSPEELKANDTGPACPPSCEERTLWLSLYTTFRKEMRYC